MPGPRIKAGEITSEYGAKYAKSMGNGIIAIKNTSGKEIFVKSSQDVYHRGKGRFAPYSVAADAHRKSKGSTGKDTIGTGKYQHTNDRTGKESGKRKPKRSGTRKIVRTVQRKVRERTGSKTKRR